MPWITKEGRTVTEAQDAAVGEAGLPADALDIEVVSEGAKGLFGLGGEPAIVRVRPKSEAADVRHAFRDDITPARDDSATTREVAPQRSRDDASSLDDEASSRVDESSDRDVEAVASSSSKDDERSEFSEEDGEDKLSLAERQEQAAALGGEIVRGILERMGLEGEVNTRVAGGTVYVEISGEEMGILIGRSGTTLEALQELVRAGVQRRLKTRQALVVDVESYWERRRRPGGREGNERGGGGRGGRGRNGNNRGRGRGGRGRGRAPRDAEPDGNRADDVSAEEEPDGNR